MLDALFKVCSRVLTRACHSGRALALSSFLVQKTKMNSPTVAIFFFFASMALTIIPSILIEGVLPASDIIDISLTAVLYVGGAAFINHDMSEFLRGNKAMSRVSLLLRTVHSVNLTFGAILIVIYILFAPFGTPQTAHIYVLIEELMMIAGVIILWTLIFNNSNLHDVKDQKSENLKTIVAES